VKSWTHFVDLYHFGLHLHADEREVFDGEGYEESGFAFFRVPCIASGVLHASYSRSASSVSWKASSGWHGKGRGKILILE
jgi:hypothetical protein